MTSLWSKLCNGREEQSTTQNRQSTVEAPHTEMLSLTAVPYERAEMERVERQLLPDLERTLQRLIDDFNASHSLAVSRYAGPQGEMQNRRVRVQRPNKVNIEREITLLRKTMRTLRRWRSGTEFYSISQAKDLHDYVMRSRERLLMHRMERIYDESANISRVIDRYKPHPHVQLDEAVYMEKKELDMQMRAMTDLIRHKSNKGVSLDEIPEIELSINQVHTRVLKLKDLLGRSLSSSSNSATPGGGAEMTEGGDNSTRSGAISGAGRSKGGTRGGTIPRRLTDNREMVNRLFRGAAKIRGMIEALKRGGHLDDSGYCSSYSASHHGTSDSDSACNPLSTSLSSITPSRPVTQAARSMPLVQSSDSSRGGPSGRPLSEVNLRKVRLPSTRLRHNNFNRLLPNGDLLLRSAHSAHSLLSINDMGVARCAENDVAVLEKQLGRIKAWLQEKEACTGAELEELDLILTSIDRHIKPVVDLRPRCAQRRRDLLAADSDVSDDFIYDDHVTRRSRTRSRSPPPLIMRRSANRRSRNRSDEQLQSRRGQGRLKVKVRQYSDTDAMDNESLIDERLI